VDCPDKADNRTTERRKETVSTGIFNNVNQLTALSGGGVVGFTGTTTEEAAVTVSGQAAQTSQVGTRFEKAVTLPAGTNTVTVAAVDPSGNTNSKNYRVVVNAGASQTFTYDANGNMTSDGVRTYAWDAENRLIKITEGTKTTDLEYDGFHHWTRILEKNGATTVSDRRFIWDGNTMVEQRNGTSTTAAQRCFPHGAADTPLYRRDLRPEPGAGVIPALFAGARGCPVTTHRHRQRRMCRFKLDLHVVALANPTPDAALSQDMSLALKGRFAIIPPQARMRRRH
jgi:YD repeat-containing protein